MSFECLKSLNWIDLLMLGLLIRVLYSAVQTGFVTELFKMVALIITLFLCFHYYVVLAGFIPKTTIADHVVWTTVFVAMWILLAIIFRFLREKFLTLFSIETLSALDKWGAAVIGAVRFTVLASMLLFVLMSSQVQYLQAKTVESCSGRYLVAIAPKIYRSIYEGFVARLFSGTHENRAVHETMKDVAK